MQPSHRLHVLRHEQDVDRVAEELREEEEDGYDRVGRPAPLAPPSAGVVEGGGGGGGVVHVTDAGSAGTTLKGTKIGFKQQERRKGSYKGNILRLHVLADITVLRFMIHNQALTL